MVTIFQLMLCVRISECHPIFYRHDKKGEREASNKMEISFVPQKLLIILKGTFHSRKMDMKA